MTESKNLLQSKNNNNLLVVLPINKSCERILLEECLYSLHNQTYPIDLLILASDMSDEDIESFRSSLEKPSILSFVKNKEGQTETQTIQSTASCNWAVLKTNKTKFGQFYNEGYNYALQNNYKHYSIVEYDDVIATHWYKTAFEYKELNPGYNGYLPLTRIMSNGVLLGFFNEACWVDNLPEFPGNFDSNLALQYNCMNLTGTIIEVDALKNDEFVEVDSEGNYKPLKENFKFQNVWEFFIRSVYYDLKYTTVPRLGYEKRIDRPNYKYDEFLGKVSKSITAIPADQGGVSPEEWNWWVGNVKTEYYIPEDRNLQFEAPAVEEPTSN